MTVAILITLPEKGLSLFEPGHMVVDVDPGIALLFENEFSLPDLICAIQSVL